MFFFVSLHTQINYKPIIMEEKKDKRVLSIELDENVKKVSITGLGDDETVVMKQELSEDELDQATGGGGGPKCVLDRCLMNKRLCPVNVG